MPLLEICTGSLDSVKAAAQGGADRVELCAGLEVGGLTPSAGYIRQALTIPGLRKHVLIRPRGGDFVYSDEEVEVILHDIELCHQLGADGVVVGALTAAGDIDLSASKRFREAAGTMSVTFHRAFDECSNPALALEQLIEMGYDTILTSGQAPRTEEALPLLRSLNEQANGRITIMPGSGVSPVNAAHIIHETGVVAIHASAMDKTSLQHNTPLFPGYYATSADIVAEIKAEITK